MAGRTTPTAGGTTRLPEAPQKVAHRVAARAAARQRSLARDGALARRARRALAARLRGGVERADDVARLLLRHLGRDRLQLFLRRRRQFGADVGGVVVVVVFSSREHGDARHRDNAADGEAGDGARRQCSSNSRKKTPPAATDSTISRDWYIGTADATEPPPSVAASIHSWSGAAMPRPPSAMYAGGWRHGDDAPVPPWATDTDTTLTKSEDVSAPRRAAPAAEKAESGAPKPHASTASRTWRARAARSPAPTAARAPSAPRRRSQTRRSRSARARRRAAPRPSSAARRARPWTRRRARARCSRPRSARGARAP